MPSQTDYTAHLRDLPESDWDAYLKINSGLTGARANLHLADAVAQVGDESSPTRQTPYGKWLALHRQRHPMADA